VRWLPTICLTGLALSASSAQQQESSLVDRLLRPNMELQNKAQDKKFVASSAAIEHRGSVGTFVLQPNRAEKSFTDTPALTMTEYPSRSLRTTRAISSSPNPSAHVPSPVGSTSFPDVHSANTPVTASNSRIFADQHQFREQGKSQKSLDRQNPPMTIDQVRELLNKNK
jgi:hypothetical protein